MAKICLLLVVVMSFIGGISGQTQVFFDIGSDILQSVNGFQTSTVLNPADANGERRICHDGSGGVYYTSGNRVLSAADDSQVFAAPVGHSIMSLTCCCNIISIAFQDNQDQSLNIWTIFVDKEYIIAKLNEPTVTSDVLIECFREGNRIVVASLSRVWTIRFDDLLTLVPEFVYTVSIEGDRIDFACCANSNSDNGGFDLFTLTGTTSYFSVSYDGNANNLEPTFGQLGSQIFSFAISTGDGCVFMLVLMITPSSTNWYINKFQKQAMLDGEIVSGETVLSGLTVNDQPRGLEVCDTNCQTFLCEDSFCGCNGCCGACVDNSIVCQCLDALSSTCCYSDEVIGGECEQPLPLVDGCVFVNNALARRRAGSPVDVVGVATVPANILFQRYVDTGRYDAPSLPWHNQFPQQNGPPSELWVRGFSAPVESNARGRRFGVFAGRFTPIGETEFQPVFIPAIAGESSGFFNQLYSYTVNDRDSVKLVATFQSQLTEFIRDLRWRFTRVDQDTGTQYPPVVPRCKFHPNRLTCVLKNLQKAKHEGVYEVFRLNRRLRIWHPIFFLFVRQCGQDRWGRTCRKACDECEQGWCDANTGKCICFPGWMGVNCNTVCPDEDLVGADCNIRCSEIFPNSVDCKGLLISKPGKIPFACRSGLDSPDCRHDCPYGYWGPNCQNTCGPSPFSCDPRTGV